MLVLFAFVGCRINFDVLNDSAVNDGVDADGGIATRVCGDTSGLLAGAAWPLIHGCPTNARRSPFAGPVVNTARLGPVFSDAAQTGVVIGANEQVLFAIYNPGTTSAFDSATGGIGWTLDTAGARPHLALAAGADLFVPTDHGVVYCVDGAAGKLRWQIQLSGSFSAPVIAGPGTVYVGTAGYGVYAIDIASRKQKWNFTPPGGGALEAPAVGNGLVYYLDTLGSRFYGLEAEKGSKIFDVAVVGSAVGAPVLGLDGVYVATSSNGIAAFDPQTGALRWQEPAIAEATVQPALRANGDLVSSTASGHAFVLEHAAGTVVSSFELGANVVAPPVIDGNDIAYYATTNGTTAIDPVDGAVRWLATPAGKLALGNGVLVVLPPQGQFVVIAP